MIITIASNKGGVSKSSQALMLSEWLATRRSAGRVVLSDGDPNHSCMSWLARSPGKHKFEILDGNEPPGDFDHLVIDTPARTDASDLMPLAKGSDLLLIPSTISVFSLEATIDTLRVMNNLPKDKYAVLLTFLPPRGKKREEEAREALTAAGVPLLKAGIKQRIIYQDAAIEGLTFNRMKGNSAKAAWGDIQVLGKEVLKRWNQ